ncbi:GNAT family N-acetyltransferase [Streptomyces termitum]|uniref:GNAT family N-acetyltransferase n=1 Tax=Streptomyces termitum TaxID=67368 RepID=UPI0037AB68CF
MNAPDAAVLHVPETPDRPALVLRPWRTEDIAGLIEACRDPVLRRWTTTAVDDEADGERWVETQRQGWASGTRLSFAVLSPRGRLLGHAVLKRNDPGGPAGEVGYWTTARARGRGVAPRALEALTHWSFTTFDGLERLELLHQADNTASCRVAQKTRYPLDHVLPAAPPAFPGDGHVHVRHAGS